MRKGGREGQRDWFPGYSCEGKRKVGHLEEAQMRGEATVREKGMSQLTEAFVLRKAEEGGGVAGILVQTRGLEGRQDLP